MQIAAYNEIITDCETIIRAYRADSTPFEQRPTWAEYKEALALKVKTNASIHPDRIVAGGYFMDTAGQF